MLSEPPAVGTYVRSESSTSPEPAACWTEAKKMWFISSEGTVTPPPQRKNSVADLQHALIGYRVLCAPVAADKRQVYLQCGMIGYDWTRNVLTRYDRVDMVVFCGQGVPAQRVYVAIRVQVEAPLLVGASRTLDVGPSFICYVCVELSVTVNIGEDGIPTKRQRMYVPSATHPCHRSRVRDACHSLAKFEVQGRVDCMPSILLTPVHIWQVITASEHTHTQSPMASRHVCRRRQGLNVPNYRTHVYLIEQGNRRHTPVATALQNKQSTKGSC